MTAAIRSEQYQTLFRAALGQSARDSDALLREVLHAALRSLNDEIENSTGQPEHEQLRLCHQLLDNKAAALCAQFPALLSQVFLNKQTFSSKFGELALGELNHDHLEQMNETEVQERVELVRVLRCVHLLVQLPLNELSGCICVLLGLDCVKPEHNPLRPQIYLKVLRDLMVDVAVPTQVRIIWFKHMATPLGKSLQASYALLAQKIKSYGVTPLPVAGTQEPEVQTAPVEQLAQHQQTSAEATSSQTTVLTLHRLHGLLSGQPSAQEITDPGAAEALFSGPSDLTAWTGFQENTDEPTTDFAATIPAAFEALQNMNQVDDLLARLPHRQRAAPGRASQPESVRAKFRRRCQNSSQLLSFEVLCQMLDNLEQDIRLLVPIRLVIENLESALFRLVKVDVRFFNDKLHPARRLLQELTQRGLAFDSVDAPGFTLFLRSLHRHVNPLSRMPINSAEPFELALRNLNTMWSEQLVFSSQALEQARQALGRAEARNLVAEKMVAALAQIPDMQRVPATIADFICGPWAQVMANAELNDPDVEDPGEYKSLVNLLLWSAQPALTRLDLAKLTRLVPRLLAKLREGLALIGYPDLQTNLFFDELMKLHQQAFKAAPGESEEQVKHPWDSLLGNRQHWVAPAEAQASGFMDMLDEDAAQSSVQPIDQSSEPMLDSVLPTLSQNQALPDSIDPGQLAVGAWVEIFVKDIWQRCQLSWISPQNSLYLFTDVYGGTQSMTRRMLEKLQVTRALRVVSEQSMVDGALDAVVHSALLNSLDLRL